jgi:hypothetical protein
VRGDVVDVMFLRLTPLLYPSTNARATIQAGRLKHFFYPTTIPHQILVANHNSVSRYFIDSPLSQPYALFLSSCMFLTLALDHTDPISQTSQRFLQWRPVPNLISRPATLRLRYISHNRPGILHNSMSLLSRHTFRIDGEDKLS